MLSVLTPYPNLAASDLALHDTQQWVERAVIGLNLCPFAKAAEVKHQIRYAVTAALSADELLAELQHEIEHLLATEPGQLETTLLIHPLVMTEFIDYHFFLDEAEALLQRLELQAVVQIAGFHPGYQFRNSEADDMANFTNRSPHPVLHLLRESSIERAVKSFPNTATIYQSNIHTLRQLGHEGWRKLMTH